MKICIIGDGTLVHVQNRTRVFVERGHKVTLVTEKPSQLQGIDEIVIKPTANVAISPFHSLWLYSRALRKISADAYHVHYARHQGAWATAIANVHPVVVSTLGGDVLYEEWRLPISAFQRFLTRAALEHADCITFESTHTRDAILHGQGNFITKLEQIVWGVSTQQFQWQNADTLRAALGLSPTDRVILSPKILQPFYNIHLIIQAMPQILQHHPDTHLLVTESRAEAAYKASLLEQINQLGIQAQVHFIGLIPQHELAQYYSLSDLVIGIPESDNKPQSLMEAMACETPHILGNLPQYQEYAVHGETTYFVEISSDGIAEGVIRLLSDDTLRRRIAEQGKAYVSEFANFEREVDKVEAIYERLQGLRRRGRMRYELLVMAIALGFYRIVEKAAKQKNAVSQ